MSSRSGGPYKVPSSEPFVETCGSTAGAPVMKSGQEPWADSGTNLIK